jgi:hypothetical protein
MIIHDFDIPRIAIAPAKTNAPLVVDPDAVLPTPIASKGLKSIARRHREFRQLANRIEYQQLTACQPFDAAEATHSSVVKKRFAVTIGKAPDHSKTT